MMKIIHMNLCIMSINLETIKCTGCYGSEMDSGTDSDSCPLQKKRELGSKSKSVQFEQFLPSGLESESEFVPESISSNVNKPLS